MSPEEAELLAAQTAQRLSEVIAGVEDTVAQVERVTGRRIMHRQPQVLDARRGELDRMTSQAKAWISAMDTVDRWLLPKGDQRTLGALLKTIPSDEAALIRAHLVRAGVLPADGAEVAP